MHVTDDALLYFAGFSLSVIVQKVSGYDGKGPDGDPPSTGDNDVYPYHRLSPCIISRPPN